MTSSWDIARFLLSLGPMQATAPDILRMFLHMLEQKAVLLDVPADSKNYLLLSQIAHNIKGSAAQLCCSDLALRAQQLEHCCTESDKPAVVEVATQKLLHQLQIEVVAIKRYLSAQA